MLQEIVEVTGHSGIFLFEGMKSSEIPKKQGGKYCSSGMRKTKKTLMTQTSSDKPRRKSACRLSCQITLSPSDNVPKIDRTPKHGSPDTHIHRMRPMVKKPKNSGSTVLYSREPGTSGTGIARNLEQMEWFNSIRRNSLINEVKRVSK